MNKIEFGDCRETMRRWAAEGVKAQTCVTSPPYFGLRDYGHDGQIGLEQTPEEYIAAMVEVFRCVWDILADDGTLWLNIGDSYAGSGKGRNADGSHQEGGKQGTNKGTIVGNLVKTNASECKPKDLIGIPWMLAFTLRADGWYLRQDIIWHKPNPMPESVKDRCTKAHEYLFLLSKSER
jgi:DNA modification methylase